MPNRSPLSGRPRNRGPWREFRALIATELFGLALRADVVAVYGLSKAIVAI